MILDSLRLIYIVVLLFLYPSMVSLLLRSPFREKQHDLFLPHPTNLTSEFHSSEFPFSLKISFFPQSNGFYSPRPSNVHLQLVTNANY